jgi:hypothetical protein
LAAGAHGISAHPERETFTSGWTHLSGNIYYQTYTIANVARVVNRTNGPYQLTKVTSLPYTLNTWWTSAGNIYINVGADPAGKTITLSGDDVYGINLFYPHVYGNKKFSGGEGHGISYADLVGTMSTWWGDIHDNEGSGLIVNGGIGCRCFGSKIYANGGKGIHLVQNTKNVDLCYNTIVANGSDGLGFEDWVDGVRNKNNIYANNLEHGINGSWTGTPTFLNYDGDYNCVFGNTWNAFNNITDGAHSITSDPKFYSSTDYRLTTETPCENTGVNIDEFTVDMLGFPVDSVTPNIGALQQVVAPPEA